jgi:hypothetical protein
VDGVILELREGAPPRIAAIEIGPVAVARRMHPRLRRLAPALAAWSWASKRRDAPDSLVAGDGRSGWTVRVDLIADGTPARAWEEWLRTTWSGGLRGSRQ